MHREFAVQGLPSLSKVSVNAQSSENDSLKDGNLEFRNCIQQRQRSINNAVAEL
jgi:hypothetical protein